MGCGPSHHEIQRLHKPDAKVSLLRSRSPNLEKKEKVYIFNSLDFIFSH